MNSPSEEQQQVINNLQNYNVIVDSVAGSGKTTINLHIALQNKDKNILLLTYNSRLRLETKQRLLKNDIKNLEVHTYHSFCVKYYKNKCYTDEGIISILNNNLINKYNFKYDIIILDEAQDITPIYYKLIHKILKDNLNENIKLCLLGDKHQNIYTFNNADYRYLTLGNKIYLQNNWKTINLSTSYRVTIPMANFVNNCLLNHERIKAIKEGENIKYIVCNCFEPNISYNEIKKYLQLGYNYNDIFVLAPSTKSSKSPVRTLANLLSTKKIPIHVSLSDTEKIDSDIIKDKIVFTTYHQSKGLERKVVLVFGFDDSYIRMFKKKYNGVPNELYVATTRASEHLLLFHHCENNFLPFINKDLLYKYCDYKQYDEFRYNSTNKSKTRNITPSELLRHQTCEVLIQAADFLDIQVIEGKSDEINITNKIKQNNLYESVSDINGLAIPAFYEYQNTGKVTINFDESRKTYKQYINNIDELITNSNGETDLSKIENFLILANINIAHNTEYIYKTKQIKDYEWLDSETMNECIQRLQQYISNNARYEIHCAIGNHGFIENNIYDIDDNKELLGYTMSGYIDCIDDNTVWEFKCVSEIKKEHIIQLGLYMYMMMKMGFNYEYKLLNILDGNIIEIKSDLTRLKQMVTYLIKNKYEDKIIVSDEIFLKNNIQNNKIIKCNGDNIIVLDLETDGANTIIQLAYNIYDNNYKIIKKVDYLINNNNGKVDYYKKFTVEEIEEKGYKPLYVLEQLLYDMKDCKYIIGHNIDFDINKLNYYFYKYNIKCQFPLKIDTMKLSINYVNLKMKNGRKKYPKLNELYYKLFDKKMSSKAHTADYDITITFRCFKRLLKKGIISLPNESITNFLKKIEI